MPGGFIEQPGGVDDEAVDGAGDAHGGLPGPDRVRPVQGNHFDRIAGPLVIDVGIVESGRGFVEVDDRPQRGPVPEPVGPAVVDGPERLIGGADPGDTHAHLDIRSVHAQIAPLLERP